MRAEMPKRTFLRGCVDRIARGMTAESKLRITVPVYLVDDIHAVKSKVG